MSRILRRPMFRGGQVIDSRGTGITSGLMDGGRVGYQNAGVVTGGTLLDKAKNLFLGPYFNDPNFKPPSIAVPRGSGFEFLSPKKQFPRDYIEEQMDIEDQRKSDEPIKTDSKGDIIYETPKIRYCLLYTSPSPRD